MFPSFVFLGTGSADHMETFPSASGSPWITPQNFPESLNGGLSQWGLEALIRNCPQFAYSCRHFATKIPFTKGHESAQLRTIVHKSQGVAFGPHLRAHLDFPDLRISEKIGQRFLPGESGLFGAFSG